MRIFKKIAFASSLLVFGMTAAVAPAYDWPAPDLKIRKTFSQRTGDSFETGVEFDTATDELTAPEKGQLLFVFSPKTGSPQNLPSSLGGFVSLAHEDNLRTVISGIIPQGWDTSVSLAKGDPLGKTYQDVSQGTLSRHQLLLFDQQLSEIVNPLLVFPPLPDSRAPVILDVKVAPEAGGSSTSLFSHSNFSVGYWFLFVDAVDPGTSGENGPDVQKGLYSVSAYLNGTEVFKTELTSLQEKAGSWLIKGTGSPLFSVITGDHEWNLGKVFFNQGTNILELVVKDFQGKETGRTFRILGSRS